MADAEERFSLAVAANSHAMFRAARAVTGSEHDAEDAVGMALERAWRSFGSLKSPEAARPWLVKIAVNCARDLTRGRGREAPLEELPSDLTASEPTASLREAVDAPPRELRAPVVLYYYEGFTTGEIGRMLHLRQGTVKSRLSRARAALRKTLEEE